jgi:helix-turn-helix protein
MYTINVQWGTFYLRVFICVLSSVLNNKKIKQNQDKLETIKATVNFTAITFWVLKHQRLTSSIYKLLVVSINSN